MSANSTPRGTSLQNIPMINPNQYFSAQKIQSSIPSLAIKKIGDIIEEYFKLKPLLTKRQSQIKGLYAYNQKMIETIENFMQHQKKVVRKYNKLCQIYVKNFKEYLNTKNVDVNFKDLMNPITSISANFSMNDWKIEIQQANPVSINQNYQEMLLRVIKKYYLNHDKQLEELLQKQLKRLSNEPQSQNIEYIRSQIRELNTTSPTTENMFNLLEKKKNIQFLIKELDQKYNCQFTNKDTNFIDEVAHIHSLIANPNQKTLKQYLDHQSQIRRSLKRKGKRFRQSLEMQFQRIEGQNSDLKEQLQQLTKKIIKAQAQRNDYRTKYQYLEIRVNANTNMKKEKNSSNSNTSLIEDTLNIGIKQTNKKLQVKISQLEKEINQLKQQLQQKQQINRHLNVKRELNHSNSQIEDLRLRLSSKLMELGIDNTETFTSGQMFDLLMDKMKSKKYIQTRQNNIHQHIQIKITDSVPIPQIKPVSRVQSPIALTQSILQKDISIVSAKAVSSTIKRDNILDEDRQENHQTKAHQIRTTTQDFSTYPAYRAYGQSMKHQMKNTNSQDFVNNNMTTVKNRINIPYTQTGLLSISQRKSVDQQSKLHDGSRFFKEKSFATVKGQQNSKNDELTNMVKALQQKIKVLTQQKFNFLDQIKRLEKILMQKNTKPLSIFQSIEKQLKNIDVDHAGQIQNLCQSIVKQLHNLQGQQFIKMVANMEQVIKKFKYSSSNRLNINQIPVLSQEENLFKSQNIMAQIMGVKREESSKPKYSYLDDKSKSMKLSLHSGQVKLQIKHQKSIYFGNKQSQPQGGEQLMIVQRIIQQKVDNKNQAGKVDSSIKMDQDQFIDSIRDFQATSRKKKGNNNLSENSLKFSQSNLKIFAAQNENSRQSQIKSSLRIADKIDKKILQDAQFISKLQQKLQQIKNCSQNGKELYWFYQKYRQAMQALENAQARIRQFQKKKENCMNKLAQQDSGLSKDKLQEKIYFLQQQLRKQQEFFILNKEKYEESIAQDLKQINQMRESAIGNLIKGIFSQNYKVT